MLNFDDLQVIKLRSEVALQQSLDKWIKPSRYLQCSNCHSRNLGNKGLTNNGTKNRYYCYGCNRSFVEPPQFDCSCEVPGNLPSCHDCPYFQEFLPQFKEIAKALQDKSLSELKLLLTEGEQEHKLRKLREKLALEMALASWRQWQEGKKVLPELKCSHCQSLRFVKWGHERKRQRYKCKNCGLRFCEPILPKICTCAMPGESVECGKCADYERYRQLIPQLVDSLEGLSLTELETRLNQMF